jgi:hypothetical protein
MTCELFDEIESSRFAALVNIASDVRQFRRAVALQPAFRSISLKLSLGLSEARQTIVQRVSELVDRDFDRSFANPADAALAAYLILLQDADHRAAATALADRILKCEGCWWAREVAAEIASSSASSQLVTMPSQVRPPLKIVPRSEGVNLMGTTQPRRREIVLGDPATLTGFTYRGTGPSVQARAL